MHAASPHFASRAGRPPLSQRAIAITLAVAAHVLLILLLWHLTPDAAPPRDTAPTLSAFDVSPAARSTARRTTQPKPAPAAAARRATPVPPQPRPPVPPNPLPPMVVVDRGTFAAGDIAALSSRDGTAEKGKSASTQDSSAPYGPGEGPGGARLYNAEWVREPTDAELSGYLPNGAPAGGVALIACQTVERFHVENCRSLGETPLGSGLSRAMRQAAWQFLVRPPRINGKPMVGAWVRIRIDFTRKGGERDPDAQ